jgi:methyl-accepting chemotaxis protein
MIMMDTDFDLLCDGVSPAEAKRLRKILADWCSGDENSFPVQLALLTKAQWRAIGRLPHILRDSQKDWQQDQASHRARFSEEFNSAIADARRLASDSKKLLDAVQADHRRQIAAQSQIAVEAIDARLKKFDMMVSGYNDVINGVATQMCLKAREFETVARKIQDHLTQGTESWDHAKEDFNVAREKINEERKRLEQRLTKRDWLAYLLFVSLIFAFGLMLGIYLRR